MKMGDSNVDVGVPGTGMVPAECKRSREAVASRLICDGRPKKENATPIAWRRSTVQQVKVQRSGFSKIRRRSFSPFHGDWVQQFKTRGERSRKTSIVGERILFNPIFNAQSAHSFEFPFIIRHEPNAKTQGMGRNQQIHGTNRPS